MESYKDKLLTDAIKQAITLHKRLIWYRLALAVSIGCDVFLLLIILMH